VVSVEIERIKKALNNLFMTGSPDTIHPILVWVKTPAYGVDVHQLREIF